MQTTSMSIFAQLQAGELSANDALHAIVHSIIQDRFAQILSGESPDNESDRPIGNGELRAAALQAYDVRYADRPLFPDTKGLSAAAGWGESAAVTRRLVICMALAGASDKQIKTVADLYDGGWDDVLPMARETLALYLGGHEYETAEDL